MRYTYTSVPPTTLNRNSYPKENITSKNTEMNSDFENSIAQGK